MTEQRKERFSSLPVTAYAETSTEGEVILPDYCPPITRLLRTDAVARIISKNKLGESLNIEGSVDFTVIYVSEGDLGLRSALHSLPFSYTFDSRLPQTAVRIEPKVIYSSSRALNPRKLYLKSSVSLSAVGFTEREVSFCDPQGEGVFGKRRKHSVFTVLSEAEKPMKISDEIEAKANCVLSFDASFIQTEKKILSDKIITKFDMFSRILYADERGDAVKAERKSAFSQSLELSGVENADETEIRYEISDLRLTVGESGISYEMLLSISAVAYKNGETEVCEDVFCADAEVEVKKSELTTGKYLSFEKDFSAREEINIGDYGKILDVSAKPEISSVICGKEELTVSGRYALSVLFTDGEDCKTSADASLPFTVKIPAEGISENADVFGSVALQALAFVESDGIEVRADGRLTLSVFTEETFETVTETEKTGTREKKKAPAAVFFAEKGESVWEIAKKYGADPAKIAIKNGITGEYVEEKKALKI